MLALCSQGKSRRKAIPSSRLVWSSRSAADLTEQVAMALVAAGHRGRRGTPAGAGNGQVESSHRLLCCCCRRVVFYLAVLKERDRTFKSPVPFFWDLLE